MKFNCAEAQKAINQGRRVKQIVQMFTVSPTWYSEVAVTSILSFCLN